MTKAATTPVSALSRKLASSDLSRAPRVRLTMPVLMALPTGLTVKAMVRNVSKDGFRVKSGVVLHVGQKIRLEMPRETIDCEVRWVDGFEAGGVFCGKSEPVVQGQC